MVKNTHPEAEGQPALQEGFTEGLLECMLILVVDRRQDARVEVVRHLHVHRCILAYSKLLYEVSDVTCLPGNTHSCWLSQLSMKASMQIVSDGSEICTEFVRRLLPQMLCQFISA